MYLADVFTISTNLAGNGAISLPCGFTKSNLPIGLQLIGPHFGEEKILQAAHAYEQAHDFWNGCHRYEFTRKMGSGDWIGGARTAAHEDEDVLWLHEPVRGRGQQPSLSRLSGDARQSSRAERGGDPQNDSDGSDVGLSDCAGGSV